MSNRTLYSGSAKDGTDGSGLSLCRAGALQNIQTPVEKRTEVCQDSVQDLVVL